MRSTDGLTQLLTYAITGTKQRPGVEDYEAGVVAGQDLPEAWWNYLWNVITTNSDVTKDRISNILTELSTVLASSGLTPNGAGAATQVDEALKTKYLSRIGLTVTDFNAITTSSLPQGSVTSFFADTGFTNGPAGATRWTGLIIRNKIAQDDAAVIAIGNLAVTGEANYPIAIRLRTNGTWLAWFSLLGSNNATSAATASTVMSRDAAGRAKVAAPSAADDIAVKQTVDDHGALTSPHSATSEATASRLVLRDAAGRAKVAAPSASDDIARKAEVDAIIPQGNLSHGFIEYLGAINVNWVAPIGVTEVILNGVGQGGNGAAGIGSSSSGGGGGAGAWCRNLRKTVVPGQSYNIVLSTSGNSNFFGVTLGRGGNGSGITGGAGGTGAGGASNGFAGGNGNSTTTASGGGGGGIGGVGGASSDQNGGGGGGSLGPGQRSLTSSVNGGPGTGSNIIGGSGGTFFGITLVSGAGGPGAGGAGGAREFSPGGAGGVGGGGGGGGCSVNAPISTAGGAGGAPYLRIDW